MNTRSTAPAAAPLSVAIIGAGPAGIYAADLLLKNAAATVNVDIFEQLPAPYGLVRYGVSPDHPRIKAVIGALQEILNQSNAASAAASDVSADVSAVAQGSSSVNFYGNVRFGAVADEADITLADLKARYNAVIFATGAIKDQTLDIAGIDAEGSFGAADFVSWFDAHPDVPDTWPLNAEQVAVIGNGNVALDVSRMLVKQVRDLMPTEIPANVAAGLAANPLQELHLFGRRGPGTVKFTPLELRELGEVKDVEIVLDERDFEVQDDFAEAEKQRNKQLVIIGRVFDAWRKKQADKTEQAQKTEQTTAAAEATDEATAPGRAAARKLYMHFWSKPTEVVTADGQVTGLKVARTRPDGQGGVVETGEFATYPVQALYRAVGYFGSELPGVPYDEHNGVIRNIEGRVVDESGQQVPGLYATGWIKRGPVGLIGHTKSDAMQTVQHLLSDREQLWQGATDTQLPGIEQLLTERGVEYTTLAGWRGLDAHERALGEAEGRERIKVRERQEMTRISRS